MKKKFRILFVAACQLISVALFAQRDTINMNDDWHFSVDAKGEGISSKWFAKELETFRVVSLPHTWNVRQESQSHYGWGWYQKKTRIPSAWKGKNVILQFGAVNHTAHIFINGEQVAVNIGDGFSKFFVKMDGKLKYGKENTITVAVNNDYGRNKVPFGSSFDWPNDGGIIRKVALIVSGKPSASYIHLDSRLNVTSLEGHLKIKLGMDGAEKNKALRFSIRIAEKNQSTQNVVCQEVVSPAWIDDEVVAEVVLPKVNPWFLDFPNLYETEITVLSGKKICDKVTATTGFRELKFVNGQTFLNGERIKLMGVEWTAGSNPDYGFAEPDSVIIAMCKLMKNVNAVFTRQHFQQDDLFYEFCDKNGILVQQEIPLWGPETPVNDTIRLIAFLQLERMVNNYYNHPSIISWGVGNELRGRDKDIKQFIADMLKRLKELDPTRMTAYVSNTLTWGFINNTSFIPDAAAGGDYLMMNEYGGSWWDLPVGKIGFYLDSVHMSYPAKPFFISEFGLCEPNFKGGDERRIEDMIYHMGIYESKTYVEGAIYFDLTDYRTHYPGTEEKNKFRRRIHGIYDMYGNPKPSMKVLRELSSPLEVQNVRKWKKDKLNVLLFGSVGLPQYTVKGYYLYVSDKAENAFSSRKYELPDIKPGERVDFEIDDLYKGKCVITVVRPSGYIVTQKQF